MPAWQAELCIITYIQYDSSSGCDLNFVPFWPAGAAVKAINSATVTECKWVVGRVRAAYRYIGRFSKKIVEDSVL